MKNAKESKAPHVMLVSKRFNEVGQCDFIRTKLACPGEQTRRLGDRFAKGCHGEGCVHREVDRHCGHLSMPSKLQRSVTDLCRPRKQLHPSAEGHLECLGKTDQTVLRETPELSGHHGAFQEYA